MCQNYINLRKSKIFDLNLIPENGIIESTYIKNLALLSKLWLKLYQLYDYNFIKRHNFK